MQEVAHAYATTHMAFFQAAAELAQQSTCLRARCGSVIVKDAQIIGGGFNSPPLDREENRTCSNNYESTAKPHYDKTCCIHAEWRAILATCKSNPDKIRDSSIYFMRIDSGSDFTIAGKPYCTTCSRLAMESGIGTFALWQKETVQLFDTAEYDRISYGFFAASA